MFAIVTYDITDPKRLKIDFTRGDLERYLQRAIRVDVRVRRFYGE